LWSRDFSYENAACFLSTTADARRLTLRIPRESALRLANLSRAVGIKHGAMVSLLLDTVSRIDASDFFAEVARIRKAAE